MIWGCPILANLQINPNQRKPTCEVDLLKQKKCRPAATTLLGGWWNTAVSTSTTHCSGLNVILKGRLEALKFQMFWKVLQCLHLPTTSNHCQPLPMIFRILNQRTHMTSRQLILPQNRTVFFNHRISPSNHPSNHRQVSPPKWWRRIRSTGTAPAPSPHASPARSARRSWGRPRCAGNLGELQHSKIMRSMRSSNLYIPDISSHYSIWIHR